MINQAYLFAFHSRKLFDRPFFQIQTTYFYIKKVDVIWKRGSMLANMVVNRDQNKNWHLKIMDNQPTKGKNLFDNIHKPTKRQNVLNSLFIKNITDVLSTGDIAPEVMGYGVEITGVKISPCCQILNVFWQIPPHYFHSSGDIQNMFNMKASSIRSELISRNVLGHVPKIFFIRDSTNAKSAAFEEALKEVEAELGSEKDSPIIPNDDFTENIYSFKKKIKEKTVHIPQIINKNPSGLPLKPADMKSDVFGLDHEALMNKVIKLKKNSIINMEQTSTVASEDCAENSDLFSKIPGTAFQRGADRDKLLKQFQIQRKMLLKKDNRYQKDEHLINISESDDLYQSEQYSVDDTDRDFIEEETTNRF